MLGKDKWLSLEWLNSGFKRGISETDEEGKHAEVDRTVELKHLFIPARDEVFWISPFFCHEGSYVEEAERSLALQNPDT